MRRCRPKRDAPSVSAATLQIVARCAPRTCIGVCSMAVENQTNKRRYDEAMVANASFQPPRMWPFGGLPSSSAQPARAKKRASPNALALAARFDISIDDVEPDDGCAFVRVADVLLHGARVLPRAEQRLFQLHMCRQQNMARFERRRDAPATRPHQEDLVSHFVDRAQNPEGRGVFIVATGTGKTHIGVEVALRLQVRTVILVPNILLAWQWHSVVMMVMDIDAKRVLVLGPNARLLKRKQRRKRRLV